MTEERRLEPSADVRTRLSEYALLAPRLVKLVMRLMRDKRVPARSKAMMVVLAGYLASPIDLVPDFIPGAGYLDDLVIAAFVLDQILNRVPEHLVAEHWDGDEDILQVVRDVLDITVRSLPARIRRRLPGI
ncbi:MAG TPA: DUF1232 domain-containing protein [Actinomycetota bacterium]|nr:DUF1232 domain-containing protein [Actinomycetota bacterium]